MKSIEVPFKGDAFTRHALIVEARALKVKVRELPKGLDGMPDLSKASPELQADINEYVTKVAVFGWLPEEREEPVSLPAKPLFSFEAAQEYPA